MAQKFIINDGDLMMANVHFHEEILGKGKNQKTIGGGWWYFDRKMDMWFFYYKSIDFGSVTFEQFKEAVLNDFDDDFIKAKKFLCYTEYLRDVIELFKANVDMQHDKEINCYYISQNPIT